MLHRLLSIHFEIIPRTNDIAYCLFWSSHIFSPMLLPLIYIVHCASCGSWYLSFFFKSLNAHCFSFSHLEWSQKDYIWLTSNKTTITNMEHACAPMPQQPTTNGWLGGHVIAMKKNMCMCDAIFSLTVESTFLL